MGGKEKSAAECLNQCLQKLLEQYYDKVKGKFRLCMCVRLDEAGSVWQVKSGAGGHPDEITDLLREENTLESYIGKPFGKEKEYVLYITRVKTVNDSGFPTEGPQKMTWVFVGGEYRYSVHFLLKILSDELLLKFDDMLLLETLRDKINPDNWHDVEDLKENRLCCYFLGNILDREWLTRQYVKQSLEAKNLPNWRTFTHISAMFYEKRTVKTCLYFASVKQDDLSLNFKLIFSEDTTDPCGENNLDFRRIRKLMEMSGSGHGLFIRISDSGVGKGVKEYRIKGIIKKYVEGEEPLPMVCVDFLEHMVWQLRQGTEIFFQYQKGEYKLPELESNDDAQKEIDKLAALNQAGIDKRRLLGLVEKVRAKADHGTALLFMDQTTIEMEVKRLVECHRAISVNEFDLANEVDNVAELFAIDGAVLLDFSCICRAAGVIVDGKACPMPEGISRGARYNSIASYVKGLKNMDKDYANALCFAVIFSEDRMVNVVVGWD